MSIDEILFSQNWILSLIFALLISISIGSWYVIFRKILFFKKEKNALNNPADNSENASEAALVLKKCFELIKNSEAKNQEIIDKKLGFVFDEFKDKASFGQNFLASTANLTPFIGLFGTVLGVYFALIDIAAQGNASISTVARPIGEALIATAFGLWCAIPAAFAYNYFSKQSAFLVKKVKIIVEKKLIENL